VQVQLLASVRLLREVLEYIFTRRGRLCYFAEPVKQEEELYAAEQV
jgi:hypothetical protein